MSSSLALQRLAQERTAFRKSRPFGFSAKPITKSDGSVDLQEWACIVPGREDTVCEGARYPVTIKFSNEYPNKPPYVCLPKGFFHVNICPHTGGVCLSILKEVIPEHLGKVPGWSPSTTVAQVLQAVQELLHTPNFGSVLGEAAWLVYKQQGRAAYDRRTREQAQKYRDTE